jgi:hypothetical protein
MFNFIKSLFVKKEAEAYYKPDFAKIKAQPKRVYTQEELDAFNSLSDSLFKTRNIKRNY